MTDAKQVPEIKLNEDYQRIYKSNDCEVMVAIRKGQVAICVADGPMSSPSVVDGGVWFASHSYQTLPGVEVKSATPTETPPPITDQMVDRAERWLCGHDAWELPYGSTGSGEAARTILEAALADPSVRGSADGMFEPGPPKPLMPDMQAYESLSGLVQHLREDVTALQKQFASHQHRPPVYGRTSGPVSPPEEPTTEPSDPGAGDDAEKWRAVTKTCFRANTFGEAAQAAVNEAVRQGLVQRIDPEDSEQHEAVMDAMRSVNHLLGWEEMDSLTTEVLVALAALKGGAR